ncbi:hypothetical protein [Lentzea californiensis]|uniref:hypothetical protein n=1 Tax=Lentzea californiensis TaxID=438851 RepID=UPI0021669BD2|nr:hypothetical protein [Lentzea californiensis]MCR3753392.1 hypothetical protein [Lentzea californiensis]
MRWVVLLLVPVLPAAASAAPAHLPADDRRQLGALTQRYFEHRADKVTTRPQAPGFGVPTTEAFAARLRIDETRLADRRARYGTSTPGGYSHAKVGTELTRVVVAQDGSAVVHVREVTELHFAKPVGVTHSTFAMGHVLIFDRTPAGWTLAAATRPPGSVCKVPPETQFCGIHSAR